MTQNQIAYKNAVELGRHNQAVETETNRHQQIQESLQKWANALQKYQIAVNNAHYARMDAEAARANRETERANRAREQENLRSNLAREGENVRSDVANEYIKERANQISAASVAETSRHQRVMETLQDQLNKSTQALNYGRAEEATATSSLRTAQTTTETYRPSQIVNEIDLTNSSANLNRERLSTESTQQFLNVTSGIRNIVGTAGDVIKVVGNLLSGSTSNGDFWSQMSRQLQKQK